jgi:CDP-4-dehydro-6-deoxyglucose reductase
VICTGTIDRIDVRPLSRDPGVQVLTLTVDESFTFVAGQYLEVLHDDGTAIPLSIASPPERLPTLCLHYRSTIGAVDAERMDELLLDSTSLRLRGPGGDVMLAADDARPLLLVSGGTGISQALCLAAAQTDRHPNTTVVLLACADDPRDLYFQDLLPPGDHFHANLIADARRDRSNDALRWLAANAAGLAGETRVILSGGPPFVWAATDLLTESGVDRNRLESDVYAFGPRDGPLP